MAVPLLLYDIHLIDDSLAVTELLDNKEYIADIHIDTTLQVVIEVDVATE